MEVGKGAHSRTLMGKVGNQRFFLRKKTRIPLKVLSVNNSSESRSGARALPFQTQDIGVGGLGVETLMALEQGDLLDIELALPGRKVISARAIVRNIRQEKRGAHVIYHAGLEFMQTSVEDRKAISDYVGTGDFVV